MSKSYSNKALPSGTVLREWRLEEVLGVGGFGIVYKGRGIYFDELVAIKEYFPSAISERKEGDTVVPIDSDAEEVHALGLKKFVEEAKLLWNLSTPTRHPNIVSVRSLFEIHGTAYMVMDFEDGLSLSKLLREGRRFNEHSLKALIIPIAEGLDRAHRVGVLHRDIKPPNILVNDDGRPVLIDFGSARFESGDATSTKVTFHTPPYAAIEQYVRTYAQGPWTDVYALGVVLYECVTGEKPPEVLERMHGGLGKPLAEGNWPGYSHTFLEAIDAAMTIRPDERPQSIPEWLKLFDEGTAKAASASGADDDDRTQFATMITSPVEIVPVAPAAPGFETGGKVETPVPEDPSEVEFKRAGHDTNATRAEELMAALPPDASSAAPEPPRQDDAKAEPAPAQTPATAAPTKKESAKAEPPAAAKPADKPKSAAPAAAKGSSRKAPLIAGAAAVLALAGGGGWYWLQNRGPQIDPGLQNQQAAPQETGSIFDSIIGTTPSEAASSEAAASDPLAQSIRGLAGLGQRSGAPAGSVAGLNAAAARLSGLYAGIGELTGDPLTARNAEIAGVARSAAGAFAGALSREAEARVQRLARDQRKPTPPAVRQARAQVAAAASAAAGASQPGDAIAAARRGAAAFGGLVNTVALAYRGDAAPQVLPSAVASATIAPVPTPTPTPTPTATGKPAVGSIAGISSGKLQQFNAAVASAREIAANVIRMGQVSKPGSNASQDEKDAYKTLDQGKKSAQNYLKYLDGLARSLSRARTDAEADRYIAQADQTKRYLVEMQARSNAAAR